MPDYTNEPLKFTVAFDLQKALTEIKKLDEQIKGIQKFLKKNEYSIKIDVKSANNKIKELNDTILKISPNIKTLNDELARSAKEEAEAAAKAASANEKRLLTWRNIGKAAKKVGETVYEAHETTAEMQDGAVEGNKKVHKSWIWFAIGLVLIKGRLKDVLESLSDFFKNMDKYGSTIRDLIDNIGEGLLNVFKGFKNIADDPMEFIATFKMFAGEITKEIIRVIAQVRAEYEQVIAAVRGEPIIDESQGEKSVKIVQRMSSTVKTSLLGSFLKVASILTFVLGNFDKLLSMRQRFASIKAGDKSIGFFTALSRAVSQTVKEMEPFKSAFSLLNTGLKSFKTNFNSIKESQGFFKAFKVSIVETGKEIKKENESLSALSTSFKNIANRSVELASKTKMLSDLTRNYRKNTTAIGTLVPQIFKNISKSTSNANTELNKTNKTLNTASNLSTNYDKLNESIKRLNASLRATSKILDGVTKKGGMFSVKTEKNVNEIISSIKKLNSTIRSQGLDKINVKFMSDLAHFKKGEKYIRGIKNEFEHSIHVPAYIKFDQWLKDEKKLRSQINDPEKFKIELKTQLDAKAIRNFERVTKKSLKNIDKLGEEDIRMFSAMNKAVKQLQKEGSANLGKLSKNLENLNSAMASASTKNKQVVQSYTEANVGMGKMGALFARHGVDVVGITSATTKLSGATRVLSGDLSGAKDAWEGLTELYKLVPGWLKAVVVGLYAATKALQKFIEYAKEGIKNLGKFQTGMDELRAVLNAPAEAQFLDELEQKVLQISTKIGATFQDVQGWMKRLAEADIGTENIEAYTEAVGKLERTGIASAETGIRALYQVTRVWGEETKNADQILGLMIHTANEAGGSFGTLSSSVENIIPAARQLGVTFEDTLGIIQFFSNQGFTMAESSQMVRSIFEKIADPEIRNKLESLGVPFRNINQFIRDLSENQGIIADIFADSEEEAERFNVTYTRTFDKFSASGSIANNQVNNALVGMRNLTNETDDFNEILQGVGSSESFNSLNTAFEDFGDNIEFVQDRIDAAWERTTISLAKHLEPIKDRIQELNLVIIDTLDDLLTGTKDFEDIIPILGESVQDTIDVIKDAFDFAAESAKNLYMTFEYAVEAWRNFVAWWGEDVEIPEWLTGLMDFFYSFSFVLDVPLQQIKTILQLLGEGAAYLNDFLGDTNHVLEDLNETIIEQNELLAPQKEQLDEINNAWYNLSEAIESGKSFEEALGEAPELPDEFIDRLKLIASTTKDVGQQQEVLNRAFEEYLNEQTRFTQIDLLGKLQDQFDLISQYADEVRGVWDFEEEANVEIALEFIGQEENQEIMNDLEAMYGFRYEENELMSKQNVNLAEMLSIEQELREMNRTGNVDIEKRTELLSRQRGLAEELVNIQSQFDDIAQNMHDGLVDINDVYSMLNNTGMRQEDILSSINAILGKQKQLRREEHESLSEVYQLDVDIIEKLSGMSDIYYEIQQRAGRVAESEGARYQALLATIRQLQGSALVEQMGRQFNILGRYAEEMVRGGAAGGEALLQSLQNVATNMVRNQDWSGAAREIENIVSQMNLAGTSEGEVADQLVENLRLIGQLFSEAKRANQDYIDTVNNVQTDIEESTEEQAQNETQARQRLYEHESSLLKELYEEKIAYEKRYQDYTLNQINNRYQREIDGALNVYNERFELLNNLNERYARGTASNITQVIAEIREDNEDLANQLEGMVQDFANTMGVSFDQVDFSKMIQNLTQEFGKELSRDIQPIFESFSNEFEDTYNTILSGIRDTSESAASTFEDSLNSFIDGLEGIDRGISDDVQRRIDNVITKYADRIKDINEIQDENLRTSLQNAEAQIQQQREGVIGLAEDYGMTLRDVNGQIVLDIKDDWVNFYSSLGDEQTNQIRNYIHSLYESAEDLRQDLFGEAVLDYVQRSLEEQRQSIEAQNEELDEQENIYAEQINRIEELINKENEVSNSISEQKQALSASADELDAIIGYTDEERSIIDQIKGDVETLNDLYIEGKITQAEYNDLLKKEDQLRKKLEDNLKKRNELELERLRIQYEQEEVAFSQNEYERRRSQLIKEFEDDMRQIAELQQSIETPEVSGQSGAFYGQLGALPAGAVSVEFDLSTALNNAFDQMGQSIEDLSDYTRSSNVALEDLADFSIMMQDSIQSFDGDVYRFGDLFNQQTEQLNTNTQGTSNNTEATEDLTSTMEEVIDPLSDLDNTMNNAFEDFETAGESFSNAIEEFGSRFFTLFDRFIEEVNNNQNESMATYIEATEIASGRSAPEQTRSNRHTEAQEELARALQEATDAQINITQDLSNILTSRNSGIYSNSRQLSGYQVIDKLKEALTEMDYSNAQAAGVDQIAVWLEELHNDEQSTQDLIQDLLDETTEQRRLRIQGRLNQDNGELDAEVQQMQEGGLTLRDGLAYLHADELVVPGGDETRNNINAVLDIVKGVQDSIQKALTTEGSLLNKFTIEIEGYESQLGDATEAERARLNLLITELREEQANIMRDMYNTQLDLDYAQAIALEQDEEERKELQRQKEIYDTIISLKETANKYGWDNAQLEKEIAQEIQRINLGYKDEEESLGNIRRLSLEVNRDINERIEALKQEIEYNDLILSGASDYEIKIAEINNELNETVSQLKTEQDYFKEIYDILKSGERALTKLNSQQIEFLEQRGVLSSEQLEILQAYKEDSEGLNAVQIEQLDLTQEQLSALSEIPGKYDTALTLVEKLAEQKMEMLETGIEPFDWMEYFFGEGTSWEEAVSSMTMAMGQQIGEALSNAIENGFNRKDTINAIGGTISAGVSTGMSAVMGPVGGIVGGIFGSFIEHTAEVLNDNWQAIFDPNKYLETKAIEDHLDKVISKQNYLNEINKNYLNQIESAKNLWGEISTQTDRLISQFAELTVEQVLVQEALQTIPEQYFSANRDSFYGTMMKDLMHWARKYGATSQDFVPKTLEDLQGIVKFFESLNPDTIVGKWEKKMYEAAKNLTGLFSPFLDQIQSMSEASISEIRRGLDRANEELLQAQNQLSLLELQNKTGTNEYKLAETTLANAQMNYQAWLNLYDLKEEQNRLELERQRELEERNRQEFENEMMRERNVASNKLKNNQDYIEYIEIENDLLEDQRSTLEDIEGSYNNINDAIEKGIELNRVNSDELSKTATEQQNRVTQMEEDAENLARSVLGLTGLVFGVEPTQEQIDELAAQYLAGDVGYQQALSQLDILETETPLRLLEQDISEFDEQIEKVLNQAEQEILNREIEQGFDFTANERKSLLEQLTGEQLDEIRQSRLTRMREVFGILREMGFDEQSQTWLDWENRILQVENEILATEKQITDEKEKQNDEMSKMSDKLRELLKQRQNLELQAVETGWSPNLLNQWEMLTQGIAAEMELLGYDPDVVIDERSKIGSIPHFQEGGHVPYDTLAMLHEGEYVLPKKIVDFMKTFDIKPIKYETINNSNVNINNSFQIETMVDENRMRDLLENEASNLVQSGLKKRGLSYEAIS